MKPFFLALALLACGLLRAQNPKPVNAKLQKATVYLQGALLYYNENVNLVAGNNEFIFENISPNINQESLQAASKSGAVMDVAYRLQYKEKVVVTKRYDNEIEKVLDSIDDNNYEIREAENKLKVLATEKNILLNNRLIKGETQRDSLQLLKSSMEFLREKLNGIYDQELMWDRTTAKLEKKRNRLNERYNTLLLLQSGETNEDNDNAQPTHQVVITVFAEKAGPSQLNFNYFITTAHWVPVYDLQATSANKSLQLKYFATVTQNSGLDWKNTQLTLSTSTPTQSNTKPTLTPWHLSFMQYKMNHGGVDYGISNSSSPLKKETLTFRGGAIEQDADKSIIDYINITENLIRTEYEIKLNYTIANGKPSKVMIDHRDVPMALEFATVPKISADAFLLAKITGWEDMNIIPGKARLYFDGGYVGEMYLDASSTEDTLKVNLGRDKSIAVTRKKIKEKFKQKFIDGEKVETRSIEIVVRNTKSMAIEIEIEDQIPIVLGTNEIKVVLKDGDGGVLDEPSGSMKWKLHLKPKESETIVFTYEIRYPKDKPIAGL